LKTRIRCGTLLALAAAFSYGLICARYEVFPYALLQRAYQAIRRAAVGVSSQLQPPMWNLARVPPGRSSGGAGSPRSLTALPYLQGYEPASDREGVTVYRKGRAWDGLNLYVSGHAPEARLVDMQGRVLHRWRHDFSRVWPDRRVEPQMRPLTNFWRRVHLLANGDLLAIFEGFGLIRINKDSKLIWAYDGPCHHDLFVENDLIYVLTWETPAYAAASRRIDDLITVLDSEGRVVRRTSLLRSFQSSDYAASLDRMVPRGDPFHTNRLVVIGESLAGRSPIFKRNRALVSAPLLNMIAMVDLERERVVWALSDLWRAQHHPTPLETGRILVFDDWWDVAGRRSRILEVDPLTQGIAWEYHGDAQAPFYTECCGMLQRLPNGNTLIVESTQGRAFEVDAGKEIVWEFLNPFRAGESRELVATLFDLTRLPLEFPFRGSASRAGS